MHSQKNRRSKSRLANRKENRRKSALSKPDNWSEIPRKMCRDGFWTRLSNMEALRSGVKGEWVRGHESYLTVESLLTLQDEKRLNDEVM